MLIPLLAILYPTSSAQTPGRPANGYVDPVVCATCHAKQAETYRLTGMGRSFRRITGSDQIGSLARGLPYYHEASATYYGITLRAGHYYQSQYQLGFDGKQTSLSEKRIDYVVGSGNHARTFLSRTPRNTLIELPLAWYAEKGGYWAMNPGYDRPDQDGFQRHIESSCMFCHNAYPDMPSRAKNSGGEAVYPATLPEGIDCQRCHGPGRAHVLSAQNREGKKIRAAIVNPARLAPAREAEVCLQCHLETTSYPLPNSIGRYDRGPFSYLPGEPLADFRQEFDYASHTGHDDEFVIAGSAYRLGKSACLLRSGAKLTCTTCHNPHDIQHGAEADQHYNAICRDCHAAPLDRLVAASRHTAAANCIGCHMPRRRTEDAVHVVITDHYIQRVPRPGDLLADISEQPHDGARAYQGEVVPYNPPSSGNRVPRPDDELYLATAQVVQGSNVKAGIPRLEAALRKFEPPTADHYAALADALRGSGQCERAIPVYEEALHKSPGDTRILQEMVLCFTSTGQHARAEPLLRQALDKVPDDPKLWTQLGVALAGQGKTQDGIAAFERATAIDPDSPEAWNDLGGLLLQSGDAARADAALRSALEAQPNHVGAHTNLGNLLSAANRFEEAKFHFEAALRYGPDDALAHLGYGRALLRVRQYVEAQTQLEKSVQADPGNADSHQTLGLVLETAGERARAIEQYREAVRLRPGFGLANLTLGWALVESGKTAEGIPYLKTAASSSEAPVRNRAQALLNRLPAPQ